MSKNQSHLRVPPHNLDAEQAVLGSVMLRAGAFHEISDILTPEAFYATKHGTIYRAMIDLFSRSEPIDLLSVSAKLGERKELDGIGGASYLSELANMVPAATNVRHYAEIVHRKHILRGLIEAGDAITTLGFGEESEDIDEVLDEAEKKIFTLVSSPKTQKFVSLKQTLTETWEELSRLHESKEELLGVPTGFQALDNLLAGFHKSDLIILAARPSVGKTTLALDMARLAATKHNIPVGIFSLEMSSSQLAQRMLSAESRVNQWNIRTGKNLKDNDFAALSEAMDRLAKSPILIDDQAGSSIIRMKSVARKMKSEHGLGLIVVDYLQLMTTTKNYDSMVHQIAEISRSLKALARELNVPVLALSQLSRAVEQRGGRPRLSDLRDSGAIEQDADVVMFIHREDKGKDESERTNIAEIIVEKHRNGPTGIAELYFDADKATFVDMVKDNGYSKMTQADKSFESF